MRESKIRSIFSKKADASFTSPRRKCSSANRRNSPTTSPRPRRYAVSVRPSSFGLGRGSCSRIAWTRNASPASCIAFSTIPVWYRSGWSFRRLRSFRISSRVSWSAVPTSCPRCIAWIALPLNRAIVREDLIVSSRTSSFSSNRPSISEMTSSRFFTSEDDPSRYLRVGSDLIRGRGQTPAATLSRSLRFLGGARGEGTVRRAHGDWAERPGWPRHRRPDRKGKPCLGRGAGRHVSGDPHILVVLPVPPVGLGRTNPVLFRGTLARIVLSLFLFVYAALFYYSFLICYWNNDPRADKYLSAPTDSSCSD